MAKKQPTYGIRWFLEDGTPLTEDNEHLTRVKGEVAKFQVAGIVRELNKMPKEFGKEVFKRLTTA